MASDIEIIDLTATGGVGQVALRFDWLAPAGMSCLSYMRPAGFEVWRSASNNRASAVKIGESVIGLVIHSTTASGYYWARAIDPAGNAGAFYPASATAGILGTPGSSAPGPNSVGPDELQNNAVQTQHYANLSIVAAAIANLAVTNAKIQSVAASKITAGIISATIEILGPLITGGTIRTSDGLSRAEMSAALNSLNIYLNGANVARFGNPSASSPMLQVAIQWVAAILQGGVSGNGFDVAAVYMKNTASVGAMSESTGTSTTSHGFRGAGGGSGWTQGNRGMGIVGVSRSSGGYGLLAEQGGVGPFTAVHDAFILKDAALTIGDIVCDRRVISRNGVDDTVTEVVLATTLMDPSAIGIVARRVPFEADSIMPALPLDQETDGGATFLRNYLASIFDRLAINAGGEGQLNVCGRGGNIKTGDLICTSTLPGKGQRQNLEDGTADDLLRNYTVARAREDVSFDAADQVKRVACVYLCG